MSYQDKINEARAIVEDYDRQRGLLPKAHTGDPRYATKMEHRDLELKSEDKAWLRYMRGETLTPEDQKALVLDSEGQYLVSPAITKEVDQAVYKLCVMRQLCDQKTISKDRLQLRAIGKPTVNWGRLETGSDIPESTMTPTVPTYVYVEDIYGLSKIGEDELMDSDVNLANLLIDSFSQVLAELEETAFVAGLGHDSQQPAGIIKDATLIANTITGDTIGAISIEGLLEMIYSCKPMFRKNGSFLFNSLTILALRKLREKTPGDATYEGAFLWKDGSIAKGEPPTLLGYPVYSQDDMGTLAGVTQVIGAFGDYKSGYRVIDHEGGMSVQRLVELYAEAGLVGFRLHKRVGGHCRKVADKPIVLLTEKA